MKLRVVSFSQLEHAHERYKLLETHSAGHKRELDTLRDKNKQLSDSLSRHQGNLSTTTQELLLAREHLAKTEVALHTLRAEHANLQQREKQARMMYEDVLRERKNQNLLLVNLQVRGREEKKECGERDGRGGGRAGGRNKVEVVGEIRDRKRGEGAGKTDGGGGVGGEE